MVKVGTKPFIELEQYSIMYLQDLIKKYFRWMPGRCRNQTQNNQRRFMDDDTSQINL